MASASDDTRIRIASSFVTGSGEDALEPMTKDIKTGR